MNDYAEIAEARDSLNPDTTCLVCGSAHGFQWTDTHGVGVCYTCGNPHTIFHYENKERVNKPSATCLDRTGLILARRYWDEHRRMVFPGCCDMGFMSGRSSTYSGATRDDMIAFNEWYDKQPEVIELQRRMP